MPDAIQRLPAPTTRLLIVEPNPELRRQVTQVVGDYLSWDVHEVADTKSAAEEIGRCHPDIILSAVPFLESLLRRAGDASLVILLSVGNEPLALKALQNGAAGYASVDNLEDELPDILERVASAAQTNRDRKRLKTCLTKVRMEFLLENDPKLVAPLVSEVQDHLEWLGFLDRSRRVRLGVALEESLLNAMIHGNLEISSSLKQQDEALFRHTIDQRRIVEPYRNRRVTFSAGLNSEVVEFVVEDEGAGYDPTSLPDPTDPANLERVSGRGLLLIRTFMDDVKFNSRGNKITMKKQNAAPVVPRES